MLKLFRALGQGVANVVLVFMLLGFLILIPRRNPSPPPDY